MINDPAAVKWLEDRFEKEFRPGGGQRIDMNHAGSRGEVTEQLTVVRHEPPPVAPRQSVWSWLCSLSRGARQ
jgi:hypothetical protein